MLYDFSIELEFRDTNPIYILLKYTVHWQKKGLINPLELIVIRISEFFHSGEQTREIQNSEMRESWSRKAANAHSHVYRVSIYKTNPVNVSIKQTN